MSEYVSVDTVVNELRKRVIEWERRNWVPYPWRVNRNPYNVLVAEILLKRTTRQAVAREYPEFIRKFPDIYAINGASVEEVAAALKHLGLYKQRAEQLKELAKALVERYSGKIPDDWRALAELPGVGPYVAGAVLSFGFGKPAPVADSNVTRLLGRLLGARLRRTEEYLCVLWILVPEDGHEYFNYGLIDLGAIVCGYRQPDCGKCPLGDLCVTYTEAKGKSRAEYLKKVYTEILRLSRDCSRTPRDVPAAKASSAKL